MLFSRGQHQPLPYSTWSTVDAFDVDHQRSTSILQPFSSRPKKAWQAKFNLVKHINEPFQPSKPGLSNLLHACIFFAQLDILICTPRLTKTNQVQV